MKKACSNINGCCDEDRCYCDIVENVVLEIDEKDMLHQIVREAIRRLPEHPARFRRFGTQKAVKERLSALLEKLK